MQKLKFQFFIVGLFLLSIFMVPARAVFAQNTLPTDTIFLKRFTSEESQRLALLYQDQYEQYRQAERGFTTAQAQYVKLGTLASLESAVVSSREIMSLRTDVLITYHELLAATLVESIGVELQLKQETLGELQQAIEDLKSIREEIVLSDDRFAIAMVNKKFEGVLVPRLYSVAYKTLSQLILADVQVLFDKSKQVYRELQTELADKEVSKLRLEERKRAYTEVDALVARLELELAGSTQAVKTEENLDDRFYNQLVDDLETTYTGIGQLLTYIEELERTLHE
ncbi:MAG: hypothetical protein GW946_01395 [Candidatus Pacebacteria bacterium]|nr:hypothetical protein [Candidatus Paceibacterota bacterium]PIR60760.1 MAG: hypothetical protein COU67_00545 [Candidatus Pacebacteria bacterium CG10_big_fil_rev_8_21_14_0_10_44_54]